MNPACRVWAGSICSVAICAGIKITEYTSWFLTVNPRKPSPLGSTFGGRFQAPFVPGSERAASACSTSPSRLGTPRGSQGFVLPNLEETPWKSFSPGVLALPFLVLSKTPRREGT